ncbi:hypothetical protein [Flavobacterium succinicans]|uniref:Uncharacterized protein n=1 Tax=Flavobacterium succinicans TaxID=29536 RepID=A0A199XQU0_9FLAO|nr:hypothetical protein [Flavobacterium succinicans]OAZ04118.1 hypothetical protein FLB_14900 [Flavobacterium succinicans]
MIKEYLDKKYKEILPTSFSILLLEEKYIEAISVFENKANSIYLGNIEIQLLKNILAGIEFSEIEIILDSKYKIGQGNSTINININKHLFNHKIGESILSQLPVSLDTEAGIDKACQLIQQYIEQEAIPFFKYWQDIRDFLPFLETKDNGFIADLFSGDGFYKKVIIWKLCSHPGYNDLVEEMLEIFAQELKESPKDKFLKKDYDKYLKILKTLEKTKPLYEWDEKYLIQKPYIKEDLA